MRQLTLLLVGTIAACTHPATNVCDAPPQVDPLESARGKCQFAAGALVKDTLGISDAERAAIPITHVVVVMQENRSFDHYFGHLADAGQPAAEAEPATFSNPDADGGIVTNFHLTSSCLPADPQHQWAAMQEGFDNGKMDGFVLSASIDGLGQTDGHFVMGYYDQSDLPLYYWLADTFAISDRYFGAALGGTWTNRDYLYAGTSDGVMNTGDATLSAPNIFDALTGLPGLDGDPSGCRPLPGLPERAQERNAAAGRVRGSGTGSGRASPEQHPQRRALGLADLPGGGCQSALGAPRDRLHVRRERRPRRSRSSSTRLPRQP
jgi:phospholipase C